MEKIDEITANNLIDLAGQARDLAYAPYSRYTVGAALLAESGNIYTGCNIENAAYTPSNCAERTAIFKAVSQGERKFTAIAVVGGPVGVSNPTACTPCGVCRQVMMEFCQPDQFQIVLADRIMTLNDLLPMGFGPDNLTDQS